MPAVSVIMPAYNVDAYLGAAIDSVLAQTYGDFELLVVDDGSTDGSRAVAEDRAGRDRRARVLHRPNGGIAAARNEAMRAATSPLFAILDSDDLWDPLYLESQIAILEADPAVDIVTGNARVLGGAHDGQPARPFPDPRPDPDLAHIIGDETSVFIMTVFRRHVYDTVGGFDETFRTNEDYDYWLRAALAGFRFKRNDLPLGRYRRRRDSLSADDVRMVRGLLRVYEKLLAALADRREERALAERQIVRFTTTLHAVEARLALDSGDVAAAAVHLDALHRRRGGARFALARLMARWTPGLLARAYDVRRARRAS